MVRTRHAALAGFVAILGLAACDATPANVKEQGRRHRLAALGIERFDSTGHTLAGVSATREIMVPLLKRGELGSDTLGGAYRAFSMRCRACHQLPSPGSKPAYLWDGVVSRMRKNAVDAGLMPMSASDQAEVLDFLQRHAAGGS
ncbi:MAG: hypothetical protein LJF04_16120 [Gemmatimonadetes bacterium]|nr:hypothetical protein [Gemmatimonadota bacterium]